MRNTDPRYVRSRLALRRGLIELAREDPQEVTVSRICEHTGVDRATFYRHFDGVDALVADTIEDLAESAVQAWEASGLGKGDQEFLAEDITTTFLEQVAANWSLHRWALGRQGSAAAAHGVLDRFCRSVSEELRALHVDSGTVWDELSAGFIGGANYGALLAWLEHDSPPIPPRELAVWMLHDAWRPWARIHASAVAAE